MTYRTYTLSSKNGKISMNVQDRSSAADALYELVDNLCVATGHRFCNSKLMWWADDFAERRATTLGTIHFATYEEARPFFYREDDFSWLNPESEDYEKEG